MTNPNRLLQLGDRLRQLRRAAGYTGKSLAELTGWQPSKVSRIETGQQQMSDGDLAFWAEKLEIPAEVVEELLAELQAIRLDEARWKARLRTTGHVGAQVEFAAAEAAATSIRVFETALAPGLLQPPPYARSIFASMARLKGAGGDVDAAVAARARRQEILYDEAKDIELLVLEAALRSSTASPAAMAGLLDRLVAASALSHVRFGIVPLRHDLPFVPMHGFTLLDDLLIAELMHTEVVTQDPNDVRVYREFLDAMWDVALEGDAARALLLGILADLPKTP